MTDGISEAYSLHDDYEIVVLYIDKDTAYRIKQLFPQYSIDAAIYHIIKNVVTRPEETLLKR